MTYLKTALAACVLVAFNTACTKAPVEEKSFDEKMGEHSARCVGYFSVAQAMHGDMLDAQLGLDDGASDDIVKFFLDEADTKIPHQNSASFVRDSMYEAEALSVKGNGTGYAEFRHFLGMCAKEYYELQAPKVTL